MRFENTWNRSETIPSSRITPDPLDSQLLLFSSLHSSSTGFRSEDWPKQKLGFFSVTHCCVVFEVCVWIIVRLEDPNMAHYKIYNRVSHFFYFFILVFDRVHDAMCLNKMTSSRNIGLQHKNRAVYFIVHMGYFYPCVHQTHLECLLLKSSFFSSDHRSQSHLKFQSCLITEYAGDCFWMSEGMSMWWCRGCLTILFSDPETQLFSAVLQLWSLESLYPLKLSSSPCIRTI